MQISDTSYIITFSAKDSYYTTVIFDPGVDLDGRVVDRFILDYKKKHTQYTKQTHRLASTTKCYKARSESADFDDLYEVVK